MMLCCDLVKEMKACKQIVMTLMQTEQKLVPGQQMHHLYYQGEQSHAGISGAEATRATPSDSKGQPAA